MTNTGEMMVWFILTTITVALVLGGGVALAVHASSRTRAGTKH